MINSQHKLVNENEYWILKKFDLRNSIKSIFSVTCIYIKMVNIIYALRALYGFRNILENAN